MAKELRLNLGTFSFMKGTISIQTPGQSTGVDVAGSHAIGNVQTIADTDTPLELSDVSTIGYVFMKNTDPDNFITIGADGANYPLKLKPGEFAVVRWNNAAIHAIADTAPCDLQYMIVED